jgi:uncharacterized protein
MASRLQWCYEVCAMNDPYHTPAVTEAPAPLAPQGALSSDEKNWAMLAHLSALSGIVFPFIGNIAGPLIVWQVKKDSLPFAASEAKEALNFNISWAIWNCVIWVVTVILMLVLVGFLLLPVAILVSVAWIVFSIIGGLRASEGKPYRYPLTLRFIN